MVDLGRVVGLQGPKGDKGDTGAIGPPGPAGESAASPITLDNIYTDSGVCRLETFTRLTASLIPSALNYNTDSQIKIYSQNIGNGANRNIGDYTVCPLPRSVYSAETKTSTYYLAIAYNSSLIATLIPQPSGWTCTSNPFDLEHVSDSKLVLLEGTNSTTSTYVPKSCSISPSLVVSDGIASLPKRTSASAVYSYSGSASKLIVAGGYYTSPMSTVKAYDASLVETAAPNLGQSRCNMGAASFRSNGTVVFYGGSYTTDVTTSVYFTVESYTNSLVKSTLEAAPAVVRASASCSFYSNIMFIGGFYDKSSETRTYRETAVEYSANLVRSNMPSIPALRNPFNATTSGGGYSIKKAYCSPKSTSASATVILSSYNLIAYSQSGVMSVLDIPGGTPGVAGDNYKMQGNDYIADKYILLPINKMTYSSVNVEYKYQADHCTDIYAVGQVTRLDIPAGTRYKINQIHSVEQTNIATSKRVEYPGPVSGYIAFGGFTLSGAVPGIPVK